VGLLGPSEDLRGPLLERNTTHPTTDCAAAVGPFLAPSPREALSHQDFRLGLDLVGQVPLVYGVPSRVEEAQKASDRASTLSKGRW